MTFLLYSKEGSPREPPHIHVETGAGEARFWLRPELRVAYNDGLDGRTRRELLRLIEVNRERIEDSVAEFLPLGP